MGKSCIMEKSYRYKKGGDHENKIAGFKNAMLASTYTALMCHAPVNCAFRRNKRTGQSVGS